MKKTFTLSIIMAMICTTFWGQQGLQIANENQPYVITFELSTPDVNFGEFSGSGFSPSPIAGQLDSDTWEVQGLSDGNINFGDTGTTGDFARGLSSIPVGVGGVYSFEIYPNDNILGLQATTPDLTPGYVGIRIQNKTGNQMSSVEIKYDAYVYNDMPGSAYLSMSHSADHSTFIEVLESNIITDNAAATSPTWVKRSLSFKISGLSIAPNDFYYFRWNIKNYGNGELDQFGIDNISITANPAASAYVYNDNNDGNSTNDWSPANPNLAPGNINFDTNITIQNGTAVLSQDFGINSLTVAAGATLNVEKSLRIDQSLTNNGSIIFISTASTTGQLGDLLAATVTGSGDYTAQRYIPVRIDGKGAYRFLTSSVNSSASIQANWQEGASSMANPNPGYGMFITGSASGGSGFDITPAGAPSMTSFNSSTQAYVAIPNTNSDQLVAGFPYAAYVWGDRSVDILTTNDPIATATTLRATGNIVVGDQPVSINASPNDFELVGNPYQAVVNMHDVMTLSTGVNTNFYYVWDPSLGTRGAYTTVDLTNGTNSSIGASEANQYLMPGQAAWVVSTSGSGTLNFKEDTKSVLSETTDVFRDAPTIEGYIGLQLFQADRFNNNQTLSDAIRMNFFENGDNSVLENDAKKLTNIDETISFVNEGQILSIANRTFPLDGETISISTNQYRTTDYVFNAIVNNLPEGTKAYLFDAYLNTKTELANNTSTPIYFSVEAANAASIAVDRFSLVFQRSPLSVDGASSVGISIYPNPVKADAFFITTPGISGEKVQISIYNVLGQEVYNTLTTIESNNSVRIPATSLKSGIYVVKMKHNGNTLTGKIVRE